MKKLETDKVFKWCIDNLDGINDNSDKYAVVAGHLCALVSVICDDLLKAQVSNRLDTEVTRIVNDVYTMYNVTKDEE